MGKQRNLHYLSKKSLIFCYKYKSDVLAPTLSVTLVVYPHLIQGICCGGWVLDFYNQSTSQEEQNEKNKRT